MRSHISLAPLSSAILANELDCSRMTGWVRDARAARGRSAAHLYAERGSPKYEKAAMRWLERYLSEGTPRLEHFAEVAADLARREPNDA